MKLDVRAVSKHFCGIDALKDISFTVEPASITAIIGPNGAGKTTLFNLITGFYPPSAGEVWFGKKCLTRTPMHRIAYCGVARTFQNLELFEHLSVLENVMIGGYTLGSTGVVASLLGLSSVEREKTAIREQALKTLDLVGLAGRAFDIATELPYGQQRLVEIARALCLQPKLLLLDEPVAGLNPGESAQLGELIVRLKKSGLTIMLVEHDMETVMNISDKIIVLNFGCKISEGTPDEIQKNQEVISAYLGEE